MKRYRCLTCSMKIVRGTDDKDVPRCLKCRSPMVLMAKEAVIRR